MIYKDATFDTSVCPFFYQNFKRPELIMKDVTALISEQFSEWRLGHSSFAKLSKYDLLGRHPPSATCVRARLKEIIRLFFSTGLVCPNIGKMRSVEKIEFQC